MLNEWKDPDTGARFTIEADHKLTRAEQMTYEMYALTLESDLRTGRKPLVTVPHDPSAEVPDFITQGRKERTMQTTRGAYETVAGERVALNGAFPTRRTSQPERVQS